MDGVADGDRAVVERDEVQRRRQRLAEGRQQRADVVHDLDGVGAGLALDGQDHRALVAVPRGDLVGLDAVDDAAQLLQPHRRAVAIRDDDGPVGLGVVELPGGLQGHRLVGAVQRAGGQVDVGGGHRLLDLVDADAAGGERARIDLHAHGVLLRAEHLDLGHAVDRRDPLGEQRLGVVVHLVERQRGRAQRQVQHGLIRRVDLLVGRRRRHAGRQQGRGPREGRLHVLGGSIDAPIERELDRDGRESQRARGRHRVDAGDRQELLLHRRGDRRGHRLRTGAGQRGLDLDGREVDVGQVAHRQQPEAHDAEEEDRRHQQRGEDRTADEEVGAHAGFLTSTFAPGTSRSCPSVTTRSPGLSPLPITISLASRRATSTGRDSTVESALTTNT